MPIQMRKIEKSVVRQSSTYTPNTRYESRSVSRAVSMNAEGVRRRVQLRRSDSVVALEELVQCGLCLERLTQPKMLPCQHTFCFTCLESEMIARKHSNLENTPSDNEVTNIVCAVCRKNIPIYDGFEGLKKLPTNLYTDSLLNVLSSETKATKTPAWDSRCVSCQIICQTKEEVCKHCKLTFCFVCWPKHAEELQNKLPELLHQLEDSKNRLKFKREDFERYCSQLKDAVKAGKKSKIEQLEQSERDVIAEIDQLTENGADNCKDIEHTIKILKSEFEVTQKIDNDAEKVNNYIENHQEISKLLSAIAQFGDVRRVVFDLENFKLDHTDTNQTETDEDSFQGIPIANALDSIENLTLHYKTHIFTSKLIWTKCPKPAGVSIPPWAPDLVYIAATDAKSVLIFDKTKNKLAGRLLDESMLYPQSIGFCSIRKEIFVSDKWKHCVHVFSSEGVYLRALCSRGRNEGQLLSPQGLVVNSAGEIIICDTGNDRVVILDALTGKQLSTVGMRGHKTELNMPTDVDVYNDKIIIADTGNHRVKIYGRGGEKVKEIGSLGKGNGQFRYAEVVTVDVLGFILVGDSGNGRIQVFDRNGVFVRMFIGSKDCRFKWVSGIYVTPDFEIIVTDYKNRCLAIF